MAIGLPSNRCSQTLSFPCLGGFSVALDATMLTPPSDSELVCPELKRGNRLRPIPSRIDHLRYWIEKSAHSLALKKARWTADPHPRTPA
jgi:hypothetical protein